MEEMLEKLEDMKQESDERADFFIRAGGVEDNDELLDELNQLEADATGAEFEEMEVGAGAIKGKNQGMGAAIHQPAAGTSVGQSDEDELRQLEMMMSWLRCNA